MSSELIPLLQAGILIILFIMIGLVILYIYLMKPKNIKERDDDQRVIEDSTD